MSNNFFEILKKSDTGKARAGVINTDRSQILTPVFMPVGTQATVKAVEQSILPELSSGIILGNTYHLYLRPGTEVLEHFGGLHKFMNWEKSILTDSGGYQVFSLKENRKLRENGVEFRSHIDGSKHFFTPEKVVEIQRSIGSDIIMVLDECLEYPSEEKAVRKSMDLSLKWAKESKIAFDQTEPKYGKRQFQFGIAQGGMFANLRTDYCISQSDMDFDGNAIGGLSVGEPAELMYEMTDICTDNFPEEKPRYLMGVGTPENLLECIDRGVDMFDCVLPTRNARNGQIFTSRGKINLRNNQYKFSDEPIDPIGVSPVSQKYSLGYLRHLFVAKETLALIIASQQNLGFYKYLMQTARQKILNGEFRQWKNEFLAHYNGK